MADVAEPVAAGDLGHQVRAGPVDHETGNLPDRDGLARAHVVGGERPGRRLGRPRGARARWREPRRRRGRSRASAGRPRRPAGALPSRSRSGTSPRLLSTECRAACPARRRCGSATRWRRPRPAGPRLTCSAPGRPCLRRSCCEGPAGCPRRPAPRPVACRRPGSGSRSRRRRERQASGEVAAGDRGRGTRTGPRRTPPSSWPGPTCRPPPRAWPRAGQPCRGRCGRRTTGDRPPVPPLPRRRPGDRRRRPRGGGRTTRRHRGRRADGSRSRVAPGTVRLRQHRVHAHDLGAFGVQRGADRAADEAGGTGQENLHGTAYVSSSPSAQAEQEHSPGSGRSAIASARSVLRRSTLRANIANTSS